MYIYIYIIEIDSYISQLTSQKSQICEYQLKNKNLEDTKKQLYESKLLVDEQIEKITIENNQYKHKISILEDYNTNLLAENNTHLEDLNELRLELSKTRERLEFEYNTRMRTENSLESVKRNAEQWRGQGEDALAIR